MPFYDLRCPKCDKEYNISASMTEKSEKKIPCPDCGSFDLETVFKASHAQRSLDEIIRFMEAHADAELTGVET